MLKTATRPNLRCRSNDLLEEERCAQYRPQGALTHANLERSRSLINFETRPDFVRSHSSSNGDLLIEQLVHSSSFDSVKDFQEHKSCTKEEKKPKQPEFLQLKKPRRGEKSNSQSRSISQDSELLAMYNHSDYWQDYVLPRGSLTTISHNMTMGPIGHIQTGLFRNKYRVALKSESLTSEELQKELILLKYMGNYPTILSCYGYVSNGPSVQIAYELAPYGSLDKVLKENKVQSFPLALITGWLTDIADAMQFLHSKGIVHGGIKAENILVFERLDVKLCNFQSAKSVLTDNLLAESLSGLSLVDETSHQLITSLSSDITDYFNTAHRVISGGGKSIENSHDDNNNLLTKPERDRQLEDALLNRPFVEFAIASKLFYVLSSFTEYEQSNHQFHRYLTISNHPLEAKLPSKQLADQLFAVLEEFCDGDPREPLNDNYKKLQRFELLVKSKIDNFVPIPPKSRLRQKLFGSSTLRRLPEIHQQQQQQAIGDTLPRLSTSPTSVVASAAPQQLAAARNEGFSTQKVIDPRTVLTEWLIMDFHCSFAEAEEFSAYFLRNGINSKEGVIHMLEMTPNFLHKYGSNYELAGRIKEELMTTVMQ